MSAREGPGEQTTDAAPPPLVAPGFAPGVVIAGRYRIEARLGAGGGGTVWRCHDEKLAAAVALKIVSAGGDLERWRREVAMARRIADRNVCRVHDLGETAEHRFVTMELVEGIGLRGRIGAALPVAEARDLFVQIVAGAAAIHAAGVVHRDLKPENVVVATDGRAVIVDFGLAREPRLADPAGATLDMTGRPAHADGAAAWPRGEPAGQTVTDAGVVVGTPRYMSPEQAAGAAVDARTDVWALALIGHELLTGALPAPGAHGRRIDPAVDARLPGVSAVLRRCLAIAPSDRYADARALAAALAGLGRRRWVRPAIAAVAGVGIVAAIAAAVAPGAQGPPSREPTRVVPDRDRSPRTGKAELFPITQPTDRWPRDAPMSVAVARDATRFAYTTAGGEIIVQPLPSGPRETWITPKLHRKAGDYGDSLVTIWLAGWFSDGSLGLIGTTRNEGYHLFRVYRDGRAILLHDQGPRFTAAVASDDRVVIGINGDAVFVLEADKQPDQILQLGQGELVMALAISPDGRQVAVARLPAAPSVPAKIQIVSPADNTTREVWSGETSALYDTLLVWLDDTRIAFTRRDRVTDETAIYSLDTTHPAELHDRGGGGYIGLGSAAAGTVIAMRGSDTVSVQVGNARAEDLAPVEANVVASQVAGWTADGHLVFAAGTPLRVVRAIPGRSVEPWPGTQAGVEIPDSVAGDSVIAHRLDAAAPRSRGVVIERIGPTGERLELARAPADMVRDTLVRCAGDHAPPCALQEITGKDVSWIEIDPATGERKRVLHTRGVGGSAHRDAALSPDGKTLAIVEGTSELVVVIDPDGNVTRTYSAGNDASLQSVAFAPNGDIWATSIGFKGRLFGVMAFEKRSRRNDYGIASSRGTSYKDVLRWYWRPTVSPDGTQVAATVRDFHPQLVRVQGL